MKIILFETKIAAHVSPITLTRPSFDILCGGTTLYDSANLVFGPRGVSHIVRPHLKKITDLAFPSSKRPSDTYLFLNASVVPDIRSHNALFKILAKKSAFVLRQKREVIAAYFSCKERGVKQERIQKLKFGEVEDFLHGLRLNTIGAMSHLSLFEYLWDVLVFNKRIIAGNLKVLKEMRAELQTGVYVGKNVQVSDNVVFDVSDGPILLGDRTKVSPCSVLRGPLFIGRDCIVNSFCEIKKGCSIGHVCKVGGEIESSIIQGYSNKQHYGFLGQSYVGEWVNLGAGTSNSDLKNTYGEIKMQGVPTGQQFLGCVIGDYVKSSVATSIYTGKVIGVNAFLYGTVTVDVPSFTNFVAPYKDMVEVPLEVAQKVQKKVLERRGLKQTTAHKRLLQDVYEMTEEKRKVFGVKKGELNF